MSFNSNKKNNMKYVKSKNTNLEMKVRRRLWKEGIRYKTNVKSLFGTPDIAFPNLKIVVFIDSCFWHGCPQHFRLPPKKQEFWKLKIQRNTERDNEISRHYIEENWTILRFWEHEINNNLENVVTTIIYYVNEKSNLKK
ncbi:MULTISPECIES: very short patch repair endonuclease [unclassified Exiguobacterium]|uniref:very short patch repair endonuclease n=1 Tax=unclassified Exiguobacterium TaxID=2644629 RepID=UPI001BEA682F|nr:MULTISPECIES: very short patch repair endonuclease [unclassified Exiguobacterium]